MSWGLSILVAVLTAIAGCFVAGAVAALSVEWYQVTSREGAAGYLVITIAFLGAIAGLLIGLVAARYVAGLAHPGFLKAIGLSLGVVAGLGLVSTVIARSLADIPPEIGGEPLNLVLEFRWPAGAGNPATIPGEGILTLGSVNMSRVQRASREGALWNQDAKLVDGRWVVPAAVPLFTRRGKRVVSLAIGDSSFDGFLVPLPARPGKRYLEWSGWEPRMLEGREPWPDSRISYRFRVQPQTEPVRTETVGPFEVATVAWDFSRPTADSEPRLAISGEFLLRYRGKPVAITAGVPGEGIPTGSFDRPDEVALVGGPVPALLAHVSDEESNHYVFLIAPDGDRPRIEYVGTTGYGIEGAPLTADPARFAAFRKSRPTKGTIDRTTYAEPGLYLIDRAVVDTRTLTVRRFSARAEGARVPSVPPLTVSPDGRSFAEFGYPEHTEGHPALAVTDAVADSVYLVPVDPLRMRYRDLEVLDPGWVAHHFEWQRDRDGIDRLVERAGFVPIPYHGEYSKYTDGSLNFRLEPAGDPLRMALIELLVTALKAERLPADSGAYRHQIRIEGKIVQMAASPDFGYVSISMDAKDADAGLMARITRLVDSAVATGKYDHLFGKPR